MTERVAQAAVQMRVLDHHRPVALDVEAVGHIPRNACPGDLLQTIKAEVPAALGSYCHLDIPDGVPVLEEERQPATSIAVTGVQDAARLVSDEFTPVGAVLRQIAVGNAPAPVAGG
jgi:hypothetical protein